MHKILLSPRHDTRSFSALLNRNRVIASHAKPLWPSGSQCYGQIWVVNQTLDTAQVEALESGTDVELVWEVSEGVDCEFVISLKENCRFGEIYSHLKALDVAILSAGIVGMARWVNTGPIDDFALGKISKLPSVLLVAPKEK